MSRYAARADVWLPFMVGVTAGYSRQASRGFGDRGLGECDEGGSEHA